MDAAATKPLSAFGFLTILESPPHGLFGGYLVLSPQGRPLEFRCSTPVQPSRAQEILYGPTLKSYLLSEVIGAALAASAEIPVAAILTDLVEMLPLAALRSESVLLVEPRTEQQSIHGPSGSLPFDRWQITPYDAAPRTTDQVASLLEPLRAHVDLCEPFERIRAALREAQAPSHDAEEPPNDFASAA